MALTEQQMNQLRYQAGIKVPEVNPSSTQTLSQVMQPKQSKGFSFSEAKADIVQTGKNLFNTAKNTFTKQSQALQASVDGEQSPLRGLGQAFGIGAGGVAQGIGDTFTGGVKLALPQQAETGLKNAVSSAVSPVAENAMQTDLVQNLMGKYNSLDEKGKRDVDALLGFGSLATEFLGFGAAKRPVTSVIKNTAELAQDAYTATKRGVSNFDAAISNPSILKKADVAQDSVVSSLKDRITSPNVSDATRVSLNPVEALKGIDSDFKVSVGGKLKKVSEITPSENTKLKSSIENSIVKFTKEAEKYKNTRDPRFDPTEIVGKRADAAVAFADKKRQVVGSKMGDIESRYAGEAIPLKESTYKSFTEIVDNAKNPSYGVSMQDSPVVNKLINDFDTLSKNGLTVAERNKFVRSWDTTIRDAKDAFGNFKENASVYTKIQKAVNAIKGETVDFVSSKNSVYRNLRKQYAEYIKFNDIADSLLGKDGALGDRIKGGATVKRAIKSNSDAGARQFLVKLKELTGYDGLRDADLALTAMSNVGDFQGLSLLEVLSEGKGGVIKKVLEKTQDVLVGDNPKRVMDYIRKDSSTKNLIKDIPKGQSTPIKPSSQIKKPFVNTQGGKISLKGFGDDEYERTLQELMDYDTVPATSNRGIEFGDTDINHRLAELQDMNIGKALSKERAMEARDLLRKVGGSIDNSILDQAKSSPVWKNFNPDVAGTTYVEKYNLLNAKDPSRYSWRSANNARTLIENNDLPDNAFRSIVGKSREDVITELNKNLSMFESEGKNYGFTPSQIKKNKELIEFANLAKKAKKSGANTQKGNTLLNPLTAGAAVGLGAAAIANKKK